MELAFTHNSTVADKEPGWGSVDKTALPRLAFARMGEPDKKSSWGFGHHWIQDGGDKDENGIYTSGTMYLHRGGLNAAWSAAMGGRSGQKAEPAVVAHLRKHFADLGVKKAELQRMLDEVGSGDLIDTIDRDLITAGLLTEQDLAEPTMERRLAQMIR